MGSDIATSEAPIACTLSIGDYKQRLTEIAVLARDALRSHERDGLTLRLKYAATAVDRVKEIVRREQECCAFLNFQLQEEGEEILVTISALEEARVAAETLFKQFITPAEAGAGAPTRAPLPAPVQQLPAPQLASHRWPFRRSFWRARELRSRGLRERTVG